MTALEKYIQSYFGIPIDDLQKISSFFELVKLKKNKNPLVIYTDPLLTTKWIIDLSDFSHPFGIGPDKDRFTSSLEIFYDYSLLVDMAIILCYKYGKNKNFVHDIFADGIINNLLSKTKKIKIPIQDNKRGDFTYMYNKYFFREIIINEN